MSTPATHLSAFDLAPGRVIAGKYLVDQKLGSGWEGEVYRVIERRTGIRRAAKLFFPQRNIRDKAVMFYAKKLEHLRNCSIVIAYHHSETLRYKNTEITCLISEYVEGEILRTFVQRRPGARMHPYEALQLTYALARGLEEIHTLGEYHGDLHDRNVLVNRRGVFFDVKIVDFYHWGKPTPRHLKDDVMDLIRLLYDALGGRANYRYQPPEIKAVCRGLRRDLVGRMFPTAKHLREYLETFTWTAEPPPIPAPGRSARANGLRR